MTHLPPVPRFACDCGSTARILAYGEPLCLPCFHTRKGEQQEALTQQALRDIARAAAENARAAQ